MDDQYGESPTTASAPSSAGGLFAGRYERLARLGRGAAKDVWLAIDTQFDREVALALFNGVAADDAIARERIRREGVVTARLEHENIVTVYDGGEVGGVHYLVLQAMRGGSLADRLERSRPSLAQTLRLGREIALALACAHAQGVVHRDVKPDNVWLTDDGSAALGDFGIAQQTGLERLTKEGSVLGTLRYISPEQACGDVAGPASDLYALGVTLYELVTGRTPFTAADAQDILKQHISSTPVPPSQHEPAIPPPLEELILDLLAKAPEDRPPSAAAVAEALRAIEQSPPGATAASEARPPTRPTPAAAPRTGSRRIVSVLAAAADIDDPEALHVALDRCGAVIERHGGTVERYLGDSLVGFFGLTESHGDDALRAAQAAVELQAQTPALRLGIETGELFLHAGPDGATIATGGAIKAAGRLAERAGQGEIVLGEQTRRSVAGDVTIDERSGRLLELSVQEPALLRVADTPFVGRDGELDALRAAFARVRDERACRVVTVAGAPGIGKSRLAGEFLRAIGDDATVLAGRCLAHGEGTAYRALADIVRGLGEHPRAVVEELLEGDEQAIRGVLGAAGLTHEMAQVEETAWALRRLFERIARDRPLVVAFEDIHWAQRALLDLLDHVVALSSGSPILLVCLTRPELLDTRPEWAAPQPNRSVIVLDALGESQSRDLARRLGAGELAGRIADRAEGNPLFVEQLVAVDAGEDDELPVSIQAVLAARIDALESAERTLLQHAAVEGRTFHAGALRSLLPERERRGVGSSLVALARKGMIGADSSEFPGEDAFRFTHVLIREAAYKGIPKLRRADLHAGVAAWLESRGEDEVVGFHFEQATVLARELGRDGERERALAAQAIARLEAASRGALRRGDPGAASELLQRATALVASDPSAREGLLPALGSALFAAGRMTEATEILDEAVAAVRDPGLRARAQVEREFVRLETDLRDGTEQSQRVADAVLPLLEDEDDDSGCSRLWSLRAYIAWCAGRIADADAAWSKAAEYAARAGDELALFEAIGWRAAAAVLGPTPVDEAIRRCEEFREQVSAIPVSMAWTVLALAVLHAMRGDFELADQLIEQADETLRELGTLSTSVSHQQAEVLVLSDRLELAEARLRATVEQLATMSDGGFMATTLAMLAQVVYARGQRREAADLCEAAAAAAANDDILTQVIWRSVQAKILAHDARCDEALSLAHEAIELVAPTDLLSHHGDGMLDLAEVLRTCGSSKDECVRAAEAGLRLYESKGNVVSAARARLLLADLAGGTAPAG